MYVEPESVELPDGDTFVTLSRSIDPPAKKGKNKRIRRPGTSIVRFQWFDEVPARLIMLFGQEDLLLNGETSLSLADSVKHIVKRNNVSRNAMVPLQQQLRFYEHAAHLVQNTERRRLDALRPPYYKKFPFHFLLSTLLIHDLRESESRLLRCEWYDEQVFWGATGMEELSLAYVLAKRRVQGRHGPAPSEKEHDFTPLLQPGRDESEEGRRVQNTKGMDLFIRVLSKSWNDIVRPPPLQPPLDNQVA